MIIFDLDDTLIDTSGAITPFKLRECLKKLPIRDFAAAYEELLAINATASKTKEAIFSFLSQRNLDPSLATPALEELTSPLPTNFLIPTTPYAKEILEFLRPFHTLALVTSGRPAFQREKLEKAGIDSSIFSKIVIPEDENKKPFYEEIVREYFCSPREVWVCGDRVAIDLVPARELGFQTIHMRWGRGAKAQTEPWINSSISTLKEIKEIIQ